MSLRRAIACVVAVVGSSVAAPGVVHSQMVGIAPQLFVIDARTRIASITLMNAGDAAAEITFSTVYGYPVTAPDGTMSLRMTGDSSGALSSAASWVAVYPQRVRLEPHARRVVRLMATPPDGLPDGEYWTRLVVSVKGGRVNVAGAKATNVRVGLDIEVRSVLPVFYRKGVVRTGVRLDNPRATVSGDSMVMRAALTRTGNAAYIGTLTATLRNARGKVVRTGTLPLGVYSTLDPRIVIPVAGLPRGTYRVTFTMESSRTDVERRLLIQGAPAHGETQVTLR